MYLDAYTSIDKGEHDQGANTHNITRKVQNERTTHQETIIDHSSDHIVPTYLIFLTTNLDIVQLYVLLCRRRRPCHQCALSLHPAE